jgi:ubiquinone/menaquinone biosynthesis C-methylase UbiE
MISTLTRGIIGNMFEKLDISEDTKEIRNTKTGKVFKFMEGDCENFKFKDEQFDCINSSLVLMLTSNAEKMIQEAYRVLKTGGCAGFSIFGNRNESKNFINLYFDNFEKYNINRLLLDNLGIWLKILMVWLRCLKMLALRM